MYLLGEQSAHADALINRLQNLPGQWLQDLSPCAPVIELEATEDLFAQVPSDQLFLLSEGVVHGWIAGRALFYWQEGDLLGLQCGEQWSDCRICSDSAVRLVPYGRAEVLQYLYADPDRAEQLLSYLLGQMALLAHAVAELKPREFRSTNGFKRVEAVSADSTGRCGGSCVRDYRRARRGIRRRAQGRRRAEGRDFRRHGVVYRRAAQRHGSDVRAEHGDVDSR